MISIDRSGTASLDSTVARAGGLGIRIDVTDVCGSELSPTEALFSESNTRFLVETDAADADPFERLCRAGSVPVYRLGTIESSPELVISRGDQLVMEVDLARAKQAWQSPLDW